MDETSITITNSHKKIVSRLNEPQPCEHICTMKEHITLLLTVSASGEKMKPLAIFPLVTCPTLSEQA